MQLQHRRPLREPGGRDPRAPRPRLPATAGSLSRELDERANRLANALARAASSKGDHVGLYLYNGAEFLEAMLAAFKIRAVPININYRYVEDELAFLCTNADLVALLAQRELVLARVAGVLARRPHAHDHRRGGRRLGLRPKGALSYEQLLGVASPEPRFAPALGRTTSTSSTPAARRACPAA